MQGARTLEHSEPLDSAQPASTKICRSSIRQTEMNEMPQWPLFALLCFPNSDVSGSGDPALSCTLAPWTPVVYDMTSVYNSKQQLVSLALGGVELAVRGEVIYNMSDSC
eukprot:TRINITY_DN48160_c0_g1_i1.p1 TRINITY_DN48160_c0_g1~~TRINITY_DN48160_c0_g1_i1.p1  ORF type:complete len:109 (-),score=14.04 TRINITY_DN48160_c0_g1_i1:79-405(-)